MTKLNDDPEPPRRILCIDGGGIRGTFPAAFLAGLEEQLDGRRIGSYFDLIAGTSTGGIIAIGLAMGLRASEILDLYVEKGPYIFGQGRGRITDFIHGKLRNVRWAVTNKYGPDALRCALDEVLGTKRIGEARTRLLIPAWNPVARSVYIYKTAHHERFRRDYKALAIDAAMATAAAPTYFPQHATRDSVGLTDGGTWANNPTALAVVEAIAVLGWPRDALHVLSLGCVDETYSTPRGLGLGRGATMSINLFMDGQSFGAMGMAKLLTGHEHDRVAIHRINHTAPYKAFKLDSTEVIDDLKGLGYHYARDRQPALDPVFFREPAETFIPVHALDPQPTNPTAERKVLCL